MPRTQSFDITCYHCDEEFEAEAVLVQDEFDDWYEFETSSGAPECPRCGKPCESGGDSHAADARAERQQMGIC